ncbi:hypothetical protein [Eubacterium callanderi]|uniref:hypothetical protein n=1 Tax=Eubacterium callanderi TaxID=53442 RepID=UPI00241D0202|nr:hypothetical protein [Eubacterium callanderi]
MKTQSAHRPHNKKRSKKQKEPPITSIHLPESHYALIPLITPEDPPAQAILKAPTQAARALVEMMIKTTGRVPRLYELNLNEGLELHCQNDIPIHKEVLESATPQHEKEQKSPKPPKRKRKRKPRLKRTASGKKVLTSYNKKFKKRLRKKTRKCLRKLNRNGFAVRIVINRYEEITIFLIPVLFCPDCKKRRAFDYFKNLQYCHRVLTLEMIKHCTYSSEVYEKLLTEDILELMEDGELVVYFEEEQAEARKRDFQKNVAYAKRVVQGPMGIRPEVNLPAPKKGEKPNRKDAKRNRLRQLAVWAQAFAAGFIEKTGCVKNWYSLLRLKCSDTNGDPLWKKPVSRRKSNFEYILTLSVRL